MLVAVLLLMFFISTGYFMVAPLLALDLTLSLHMAVTVAGVLVGMYVFLSQAMQTVAGVLTSRYGTLPVLLCSAAVALAGYLLLAVAQSTAWITVAIGLAAIGNGGRTVSMKTLLTSVSQRQGVRALTMRSLVVNMAAAIGPLLGVLLLRHFAVAFLAAGLVNVPLAALAVRLRHRLRRPPDAAAESWRNLFAGIGTLLRHPLLRNAMAGSIGFWLLFAQISLTVPLYVHQAYHSAFLLSAMFVLNAVLAAVVQATMLKGLTTQPDVGRLLAVGLVVTGCSFLPLALHLHGAEVFAFAVIFTFGEAITVPMLDAAAGVAADWSISAGSAFGLMAIGWAIGGLMGNDLGGLAFSVAEQHQQLRLLWMCLFLVGCGSAAVMTRARRSAARAGET